MFNDYLTLKLVNMTAGLLLLAGYFLWGMDHPGQRHWAAAFAMVGLVAFLTGLHMTWTWPLPKLAEANLQWANIAFGEMSVLLGVLFLGAALAVGLRWSLLPVGVYAFLAGATAILVGVRIAGLGLTNAPVLTAVGFGLTGLAGVLTPFVVSLRGRALRIVGALVLAAAAVVWAVTGYLGYWVHLERFSKL